MKKIIYLLFCINSFICLSQSRLSLGFDIGMLTIKKDYGLNSTAEIDYKISNNISVYSNCLFSKLNSDASDKSYNFSKIGIGALYGLNKDLDVNFSSITGFSYVIFENNYLKDNHGLGIDLGFLVSFKSSNRLSYGFKLINTFSTISNGGILQSNLFFKYNL